MLAKSFRLTLLLSFALVSAACSTHYGAAKIVSNPPGAEVISDEDGTIIGTTPTTAWWKDSSSRRKNIILRFKKDGYYEKVTPFWLSMRHKNLKDAQSATQLVEVVLDSRAGQ